MQAAYESKNYRILAQDTFVQLYENHMFFVDKDYAEHAKKLSEQILKDTILQQAISTDLRDFREGINDYLNDYAFYKQYSLYNKLVANFADITVDSYFSNGRRDAEYIAKLLKKHGYNSLNYKYENEFKQFMLKIVLPKYEKFVRTLPSKEFKLHEKMLEWTKELKECQEFSCYDDLYDSLTDILYTPKETFLRTIKIYLDEIYIENAMDAYEMVTAVLKHPKLIELEADLQKNLTGDIQHFIKEYKTNNNIDHLRDLLNIFNKNIIAKYYNNTKISKNDHILLRRILDEQGYADMKFDIAFALNDFIENDLPWIFENFRDSFDENEWPKEKELADWYDSIVGLTSYEDIMKTIDKLSDLKNIKSKDILIFQPF